MSIIENKRIYGEEIFFNFVEVDGLSGVNNSDFIIKIKEHEIDGFVAKNIFSEEEIEQIKHSLVQIPLDELISTSSGKIFPAPFASIMDTGEYLERYFSKRDLLEKYNRAYPPLQNLSDKLELFFQKISGGLSVTVPKNKNLNKKVTPGTYRFFYPNMGGLHVHCGNYFQSEFDLYFSQMEDNVDLRDQLSYFIVLQKPEEGGELTIYDLRWENVKRKEQPLDNDFVIDDDGRRIPLSEVRTFKVNPVPGDILVFLGGTLWHRVEDIKGDIPRITFGGFINFSKNDKELYYWS